MLYGIPQGFKEKIFAVLTDSSTELRNKLNVLGFNWNPLAHFWARGGGFQPHVVAALKHFGVQPSEAVLEQYREQTSYWPMRVYEDHFRYDMLLDYQKEALDFCKKSRSGVVALDIGLGKCVEKEALVAINGTLVRAEDVWNKYASDNQWWENGGWWAEPKEELTTDSIDKDGKMVKSKITKLYRQHITEQARNVILCDGSEITTTKQHKFLRRDFWDNNFQVGDWVCVPSTINSGYQSTALDPELVIVLAWQIAEGYESKNGVGITQKDSRILYRIKVYLENLSKKNKFNIYVPYIELDERTGCRTYKLHSIEYRKYLQTLGYSWGNASKNKSIPDIILQSDLETTRIFLREYFTAEGSAVESMGVEISTASYKIIQQLSYMLRRFGIWMRISKKHKMATNGTRIKRLYWNGYFGGNSVRIFEKEIGFSSPKKNDILNKICSKKANTNVEVIPILDILAEFFYKTGIPPHHFKLETYLQGKRKQDLSKDSLNKLITQLDYLLENRISVEEINAKKWQNKTKNAYKRLDYGYIKSIKETLINLRNREIFYCPIKEIREILYDGWVYDFEVEEHHNYVANGILCHNTATATAYAEFLGQKTLVVCPASLRDQWHSELVKFTSQEPARIVIDGTKAKREKQWKLANNCQYAICSYDLLRQGDDLKKAQDYLGSGLLILDEVMRAKNRKSQRTKAIIDLRQNAGFCVSLTGCPVENSISELYTVLNIVSPGFIPSYDRFAEMFLVQEMRQRQAWDKQKMRFVTKEYPILLGEKNIDTFREIIKPLLYRREKRECLSLPPASTVIRKVELSKEQRRIEKRLLELAKEDSDNVLKYFTYARENIISPDLLPIAVLDSPGGLGMWSKVIGETEDLVYVPSRVQELLEGKVDPSEIELTPRLQEVANIIEESGKSKIIIYSPYVKSLEIIARCILKEPYAMLIGGRNEVEDFKKDKRVLLMSSAGEEGHNLQVSSILIILDKPYNPAKLLQLRGRIERKGQLHPMTFYELNSPSLIEARVNKILERKEKLSAKVLAKRVME